MSSIPLKMNILQIINLHPGSTIQDIYIRSKVDYKKEKQVNMKNLEYLIGTLKAVGLVEVQDVLPGEDGGITETYKLSASGKDALKYIPK